MEILSVNNARVKQWAQLLQKKGRDRQGKFIAEGIHLVQEALRTNFPIECIVYDIEQGWPETIPRPNGLECIAVSSAIIKKCTDAVTPQPIFAIMPMLTWTGPSMQTKQDGLVVAIDGIQDPGNLGTLIRSADAVAADAVWVQIGGADLYNPKTVRASMGSIFHLPVVPMDLTSRLSRLQVDHEQMRIVGSLLGA